MRSTPQRLLLRWHGLLQLPRQTHSWYRARLQEEIRERRLATTRWEKLSETADVFYTISRAHSDGHRFCRLPPFTPSQLGIYAYLISKFTLRWQFYRIAAFLCAPSTMPSVREVVNPSKDAKVQEVARRHNLDPAKFTRVCRRLRLLWPLLP
ncbi:hypothetical protein B0I35DRAFT_445593 [Stachybotrys elegans]|uniref:Uncharacterized protein n=1 Tax=Stachybotrys elegans TaxID=80388 RepID=A0A8K0WJD6_9HYPO|nr:hypothetical protein B0I35DRAFT_445593 [Stachybotrys elegans]